MQTDMAGHHEFLNPLCLPETLDRFTLRRGILNALLKAIPSWHGIVLDVGCGEMPYRAIVAGSTRVTSYVGLDVQPGHARPCAVFDGVSIPLSSSSVDVALATEVLEHVKRPAVLLQEVWRVLRPRGSFFATVPFLWPIHCAPDDEWRFTPFSLKRLLADTGFSDVQVEALGGWDASLAQMIGLWIHHRPMSTFKQWSLSHLGLPLIRFLLRHDHRPQDFARPGLTMVTGLSVTAVKGS